jgi:hypothetical protein
LPCGNSLPRFRTPWQNPLTASVQVCPFKPISLQEQLCQFNYCDF